MEMSEQINELAAALAKAQLTMRNAAKTSENPFFKSKYADLAEVLDVCREPLAANGLAVAQPVGAVIDNSIELTTILMHSSGQWMKSTMNFRLAKMDPQSIGSCISYMRRYGLSAMIGIAQSDDDAEVTMNRSVQQAGNAQQANAQQANAQPAQHYEFYKFQNDILFLLSKKNGKYADARQVPLERLNDMLNDQDYKPVHKQIYDIMAAKGK